MQDGRLLLQIKDAPFNHPVLAKFASDGTLKMLCYLVLLYDPKPPPCIGIEEPENFLHPRLLLDLAQECRAASSRTQLLVTTHSPFFLNALRPNEVRVLWRDERGYTQTQRAVDLPGVSEFVQHGALLGQLWMEGQISVPATRWSTRVLRAVRCAGADHVRRPSGIAGRGTFDGGVLAPRLESIAQRAGLRTRTRARGAPWQLVNRIAIEELEAWYFGDWTAVRAAYPRVLADVPRRQGLRDPDAIAGGTWEAFERVMQQRGYFKSGLTKIAAARAIGAHVDPQRSSSHSFRSFGAAIAQACT